MQSISKYLSRISLKNNMLKYLLESNDVIKEMFNNREKTEIVIPKPEPVKIIRATQSSLEVVLHMMKDHYFPDEPVSSALQLKSQANSALDDYVLRSMKDGGTLLAVDNDNIVGSIINCTSCPWDSNQLDLFAEQRQCQNTCNWLKFNAMIQRMPQVYEYFDELKVWEMTMLTVVREHRNRGLGKLLVQSSLDLGRDLGYRIARMDCTCETASRIAQEMQMHLIHCYPYHCYRDRFGMDVLNTLGPVHTHLKVYVENLRKESVEDKNWLANIPPCPSPPPVLEPQPVLEVEEYKVSDDESQIGEEFAERNRSDDVDLIETPQLEEIIAEQQTKPAESKMEVTDKKIT